jgi:nitroreductase
METENAATAQLGLTPDEVLATTRAVRRRLDFDRPVDLGLIESCVALAVQAPTAANQERWRWMVVADPAQRMAVADVYRAVTDRDSVLERAARAADATMRKMYENAVYLADNMHRAPVLVVPCIEGVQPDPGDNAAAPTAFYASILPAVWGFQLALRSRGLGSCFTCAHLRRAGEMAQVLDIPEGQTQVALLPVAHTIGTDFRPARRRPAREVTFVDRWGQSLPDG